MATPKERLAEYFKTNLTKGYTEESLKWALVSQGYSRTEVNSALEIAKKEIEKLKKPVVKEKPKITHEYYDADNKPISYNKKPWWKRIFGFD